jgi:hypothetical protein
MIAYQIETDLNYIESLSSHNKSPGNNYSSREDGLGMVEGKATAGFPPLNGEPVCHTAPRQEV